jgi:hypothetical protein
MTEPSLPVTFGVLAYGPDPRLHREATVALLTIREFAPAAADVVLFTDHPHLHQWIAGHITIDPLTAAGLAAWRGPANDRFRPKLEALRALSQGGTHAVLVDTDTMARGPLEPLVTHLQSGGFVLYEREYRVAAAPRRGDRLLKHEIVGKRWSRVLADEQTWMWNGGVIGVSGRHAGVADHALRAFDELRQASTHFALEQLAYSIVFPAYGPLRAASDCFIHYWANRAWFDRRIDRFLSTALMEQWTPRGAGEHLRERPIQGALDGRLSSWQRHVRQLLRIEMDDDAERFD